MTRLILTATDSGAGCLIRAGIADIVIPLGFRFVWGALLSAADLEVMLGSGSLDHFPKRRLGEFHSIGMGPLDLCERCETVELWFDPLPKAQLVLVQLLDCLRSHDKIISKLALFQSNVVIGDQPPEALSEWKPPGVMTALGKAVLAQSEDFSRHNPIHRWWGGTELTNGRLWRWDPRFRALVGP